MVNSLSLFSYKVHFFIAYQIEINKNSFINAYVKHAEIISYEFDLLDCVLPNMHTH